MVVVGCGGWWVVVVVGGGGWWVVAVVGGGGRWVVGGVCVGGVWCVCLCNGILRASVTVPEYVETSRVGDKIELRCKKEKECGGMSDGTGEGATQGSVIASGELDNPPLQKSKTPRPLLGDSRRRRG